MMGIFIFSVSSCQQTSEQQETESSTEVIKEIDSLDRQIRYYLTKDPDSAQILAKKTLGKSRAVGYTYGEAVALAKLARYSLQVGDYDSALTLHQMSLQAREEMSDARLIAGSHIHFSSVYIALEQWGKALESVNSALEISSQIPDSGGIFNAYNQLGIIYGYQDSFIQSKYAFQKSYDLALELEDTGKILRARDNLGVAYIDIKMFDSAEVLLSSNYHIYDSLGLTYRLAGLKTNLGNALLGLGKDDEAIKVYKSAYLDSKKVGGLQYISTSLIALKNYYTNVGIVDSALKYSRAYIRHRDSTFNQDLRAEIANAEVKFDVERFKLENENHEAQIAKDQRIKVILIITISILFMAALLIVRNVQQKRKLAEQDAELQRQRIDKAFREHETKIFEAMVEVQEEERKRIAEDLHDRLGSILSAVKLHFAAVEDKMKPDENETEVQYQKAYELLDVATQEVRSISHDMLSNVLVRFGLMPALHDLQETLESSGQIEMQIFEHGMKHRLDNKVEIALYRVIQELISNILKHAQADRIELELNMNEGHLNLIVNDDGVGFDPKSQLSMGVGLQNIEKRLRSINGEMHIDSKPNKGTSTIIDITLDHD